MEEQKEVTKSKPGFNNITKASYKMIAIKEFHLDGRKAPL